MTSVYIEQEGRPDLTPSLVFWPNYKFTLKDSRLFLADILASYQEPFFTLAFSVENADFLAVPFEYFDVVDHFGSYLERVYTLARSVGKKVLLFDYTDYVDREPKIPDHAILFRVSAYRHHKKSNEIVMPYFVQDFSSLPLCGKHTRPVIGFCGLANHGGLLKVIRSNLKWYATAFLLLLLGDANITVHRKGIFWRKECISILRKTKEIETAIVERSSYSLHSASIQGEPRRIRSEYIENLRASSISLVARGDANASQRFYEALSAGRIPLFLDTDSVLPLEESISYDTCMIRVPWSSMKLLGEKAAEWYVKNTESKFVEAQKNCRRIFQDYLRLDRYFSLVFDRERSPYRELLFTRRIEAES